MYAIDLLPVPGAWLHRVRVWYARGRTWGPAAHRTVPFQAAALTDRSASAAGAKGLPAARAG